MMATGPGKLKKLAEILSDMSGRKVKPKPQENKLLDSQGREITLDPPVKWQGLLTAEERVEHGLNRGQEFERDRQQQRGHFLVPGSGRIGSLRDDDFRYRQQRLLAERSDFEQKMREIEAQYGKLSEMEAEEIRRALRGLPPLTGGTREHLKLQKLQPPEPPADPGEILADAKLFRLARSRRTP